MLDNLKENFSHIFEDALIEEIGQVGVLKEVKEGENPPTDHV